jgi:hydrogenase maturation protease
VSDGPAREILILCIGNAYRRDDGAALAVADRLDTVLSGRARIERSWGQGTALTMGWPAYGEVIIVDAVDSDAPAGTIHAFDGLAKRVPKKIFERTKHRLGTRRSLDRAKALGQLPRRLTVYAIEGERFEFGTRLSAAVEAAVADVVRRIEDGLAAARR